MELLKRSFQDLKAGDECLFRTDKQIIVSAVKLGTGRFLDRARGEEAWTGQFHEVWHLAENRKKGEEGLCSRCGRPW